MFRIECVFHGENGRCEAPVAGSQAMEHAAVYYCRPSAEKNMEKGTDPNCNGSSLVKKDDENVARSREVSS